MKKLATFSFLFFLIASAVHADHITGGEMSYKFTGTSNGTYNYSFTLKLYMRCNSGRSFNNPTVISVFDKGSNSRIKDMDVFLNATEVISLVSPDPCISNPPTVCYEVGYYYFTLSLPGLVDGYIVAGQVNYRISGIANLSPGYSQIGATYTAEIPGTVPLAQHAENNSARFTGSDLVIVCANNPFTYSFAAEDPDKDQLNYLFCEAYRSTSGPGGGGGGNNATAPAAPPYPGVPYGNNYNGHAPLGNAVQIDAKTGLIKGIAPPTGVYVVTVCVTESRNGKIIATQRKDLQIAITSCNITAALLHPEYILCRDTKTITIANLSLSNLINSYQWEFRNSSGTVINTSASPVPTYTFPDTGLYSIKLVINPGQRCSDSTTAIARVYPGFVPAFKYQGVCVTKPTRFTDLSTTSFGTVNSWNWDFGDDNETNDFSDVQNPVYTYASAGIRNVQFIATNTKGCRDTVVKPINLLENPPLLLAFKDTTICVSDKLQLKAAGGGSYTWSPAINIINANTSSPTVSPLVTTTYYASLNDNGCQNRDSVLVRVTDHVELAAMNDTVICQGDAIRLRVVSDGLLYAWTPAVQLDNPVSPNPQAVTDFTTTYRVTARIGSCSATDQVVVTTVPYPFANAGADTIVCFGGTATLHGQSGGNIFRWSPEGSLDDPTAIDPVAKPASSTAYVLSVYDSQGCPKAGTDTVFVVVLPKIIATASHDTAIVMGEPVRLAATGGNKYLWQPALGLSAINVPDPVALFNEPHELLVFKILVFNGTGCFDSVFLRLKVFGTAPTVFVPTAFTPNGDGTNDILRPIAVGMQQIEHFTIYNRFGQMVFNTTANGHGWDGKINGQLQSTSAYVWTVSATDYKGKPYTAKGTSTLIR